MPKIKAYFLVCYEIEFYRCVLNIFRNVLVIFEAFFHNVLHAPYLHLNKLYIIYISISYTSYFVSCHLK